MADLGPQIVLVIGTLGGTIVGAAAQVLIARSHLGQERSLWESQRQAALADERRQIERDALTELIAMGNIEVSPTSPAFLDEWDRARFLAYRSSDPVVHDLAELMHLEEMAVRAAYVLRTPPEDRTDTGHRDAWMRVAGLRQKWQEQIDEASRQSSNRETDA